MDGSAKPWLDAAAMATRSFRPRSMESPPQVSVVFLKPVFADGAEYVEIECVFERHGAVRHARGNAQHLPLSDHDLPAADLELQRALEDAVSYTHLRAHETRHDLVCRLLL